MKRLITLFILLCAATSMAQKVRVINKSDLQPVSNCSIYNSDKTISITTDNKGIADISKFKNKDKLSFTHISFLPVEYEKSFFTAPITDIELTVAVINLQEVVLSANKTEEKYRDLPVRIDIIPARQIQFSNSQTTADLLQQNGTVYIQQSQLGGGSAVLRGMETNRILMVVDGVRMNNAIYRAGHIQNVITIDPNILSRVEVVHGPGSVIYGSDAMGGVMHFYTRNPVLSTNGKVFTSGNAMLRYSSAANEFSQSYNINVGGKKIAALIGGSTKKIGDLREGSNRNSKYGDWGKRLYYAERIDGEDVMTANSNPLVQKGSGYSQYDLFGKILFKPTEYYALTLNMQFSNSSDIPRYDRLTEMSGTTLKYAEWYYGPQTRALISLKNEWLKPTNIYDNASVTAAYQNISEDRISRSFGKSKTKHQEETVHVFSLNADFLKKIFNKSELRYGLEGILNLVDSKAYNKNVNTAEITYDAASRYPDGGDNMKNFAAYASNNWEINEKLIFSQGIRFNYVSLEARYLQAMMDLIKFPFDATMTQDNTATNGSLGLVFMPGNGWRMATNLSTGFRAPNIDDLSKLNDSNSTDQLIIVPNPELKPENAYNAELTLGKTFGDFLQLEITGYYTLLANAFVTRPFLYNGQDSIEFDGTLCAVQAMQNTEKAIIYGFEGNLLAQITKSLSLRSSLTYTYGHVKTEDVPLDHIPPMFGLTSIKLELSKFTGEFYARYNAWKHIKDYSPSGEDNEAYATVDGMPAWFTLNLRAGYQFNRNISLQAGIENILDKHYRNFASGISAPGINVFVTLRATL
ncbi:MAG: TonB-dependent receptor [Lentimicrobiaceae bacterium]|jgi:hemoglobin/transferrin/lactoferrin receptor protein